MRNLLLVLVVLVIGACSPWDHAGYDIPSPPDAGPCGLADGGCDCPDCPSDAGLPAPDAGDTTPDAGVSTPDAGCDCPECPDAGPCQCPDAGITDPYCWADEECDDGNECTLDECVGPPAHSGRCRYTLIEEPEEGCDDGNACNGEEWWSQSTCSCQPGEPPVCDDQDACTTDSCDPANGCVYEEVVCTDDAPICLDGECVECVVDEDCPVLSDLRCHWQCDDNVCVYYDG